MAVGAGAPCMKASGKGKHWIAGLMLLLLLASVLTPIESGHKMVAPLAALWNPEEADDGHGDEKKLRADSPAIFEIFDYACILKSCKKGLGRKKNLGNTDQKKIGISMRSRKRL
jgi:hypothetical protein